jgi:hypothetical protein
MFSSLSISYLLLHRTVIRKTTTLQLLSLIHHMGLKYLFLLPKLTKPLQVSVFCFVLFCFFFFFFWFVVFIYFINLSNLVITIDGKPVLERILANDTEIYVNTVSNKKLSKRGKDSVLIKLEDITFLCACWSSQHNNQ